MENRFDQTADQDSAENFSGSELLEGPEVEFLGAFEEDGSQKQGPTEDFHCIRSYLPNVIKLNKRSVTSFSKETPRTIPDV